MPLDPQWSFGAFCVLQVVDFMTTYGILRLGGVELNPVVRGAMRRIGVTPALLLAKALAIVAVFVVGHVGVILVLDLVYLCVAINNVIVIRRLLRFRNI